jgi:YVTN family beta-propeller protein
MSLPEEHEHNLTRFEFLKRAGLAGTALQAGAWIGGPSETAGGESVRSQMQAMTEIDFVSVADAGGGHPGVCGATPDFQLMFIPCQDTNNVVVVDRKSRSIIKTIELADGNVPWDAVCSPDGRFCYVSNSAFDEELGKADDQPSTLSVIDVKTLEQVGSIGVGRNPNGLAVDPQRNRLFVANRADNNVSVIDLSRGTVLKTVRVGEAPFSISVAPDHKRIVVVNFASASISVIDAHTLRVQRTIVTGTPGRSYPHPEWGEGDSTYMTFADSHTGWVVNFRSREMHHIDLGKGKTRPVLRLPRHENPTGLINLDSRYGLMYGTNIFKLMDLKAFTSLSLEPSEERAMAAKSRIRELTLADTDVTFFPSGLDAVRVPLAYSAGWEVWTALGDEYHQVAVVPIRRAGRSSTRGGDAT